MAPPKCAPSRISRIPLPSALHAPRTCRAFCLSYKEILRGTPAAHCIVLLGTGIPHAPRKTARMANTCTQILYHIVFFTKCRECCLTSDRREDL
jgi:hypothetical protein